MFCFNHKFGKVQDDGYQYCEKCGKSNAVEHVHVWKEIEDGKVQRMTWSGTYQNIGHYCVLKCIKCGKLKREEARLNGY